MKNKKMIVPSTGVKLPITRTIAIYLLLHHFNANDIVFGAFYALAVILWIFVFVIKTKQKSVDLESFVKDKFNEFNSYKSANTFQEKRNERFNQSNN